jgi:hypothetical protein
MFAVSAYMASREEVAAVEDVCVAVGASVSLGIAIDIEKRPNVDVCYLQDGSQKYYVGGMIAFNVFGLYAGRFYKNYQKNTELRRMSIR